MLKALSLYLFCLFSNNSLKSPKIPKFQICSFIHLFIFKKKYRFRNNLLTSDFKYSLQNLNSRNLIFQNFNF